MNGLDPRLMRLFQLVSPALPTGGFHHSEGLETAVARGWVSDDESALVWIRGRLISCLAATDLPVLARLCRARAAGDGDAFARWAALLCATRDSGEARAADRDQGRALARLLDDLGVAGAAPWRSAADASLAVGFALAASAWGLGRNAALAAYAWVACESQVAAAVKLVPLGQTAGQRLLGALGELVPPLVAAALTASDREIGGCAPGASLAAMWHEDEPVRLFRS
jgi:urease accessory protein